MKHLIKTAIASILALSLVYIPVFAQSPTPVVPQKTTEAGPIIPGITTLKVKQMKPIEPAQFAEVAPVAPIPTPVPQPAPVIPQAQSAPVAATGDCVTGWVSGDFYLDKIVAYESGGRSCATNPGDCFGLLQACPGAPLRAACGGDPGCQIAWFEANKTGGRSWAQVWQHELDYGWW